MQRTSPFIFSLVLASFLTGLGVPVFVAAAEDGASLQLPNPVVASDHGWWRTSKSAVGAVASFMLMRWCERKLRRHDEATFLKVRSTQMPAFDPNNPLALLQMMGAGQDPQGGMPPLLGLLPEQEGVGVGIEGEEAVEDNSESLGGEPTTLKDGKAVEEENDESHKNVQYLSREEELAQMLQQPRPGQFPALPQMPRYNEEDILGTWQKHILTALYWAGTAGFVAYTISVLDSLYCWKEGSDEVSGVKRLREYLSCVIEHKVDNVNKLVQSSTSVSPWRSVVQNILVQLKASVAQLQASVAQLQPQSSASGAVESKSGDGEENASSSFTTDVKRHVGRYFDSRVRNGFTVISGTNDFYRENWLCSTLRFFGLNAISRWYAGRSNREILEELPQVQNGEALPVNIGNMYSNIQQLAAIISIAKRQPVRARGAGYLFGDSRGRSKSG